MDMLSFFRRRTDGADGAAAEPADAVQSARTRARRRLVGAAVLVAAGIVGFPLLFETEPRPIPIDVPIEIPRKEGATPLAPPAARRGAADAEAETSGEAAGPVAATTGLAGAAPRAAHAAPQPEAIITETPADAGREVPPPAAAPARVAASAPARAAAGWRGPHRRRTHPSAP